MRCLCCLNHLEEVQSDNLAIYRCRQPDCILFRVYQAGLEEPVEETLDEIAERIIQQHHDEPPAVPVTVQ